PGVLPASTRKVATPRQSVTATGSCVAPPGMAPAPRNSSSTPGCGSVPRYSCTGTSAAVPAGAAICWLTMTRNGATGGRGGRATGVGSAGAAGAVGAAGAAGVGRAAKARAQALVDRAEHGVVGAGGAQVGAIARRRVKR